MSTDTESAVSRVFSIPELRFLICRSGAGWHTLPKLALVSRDWAAVATSVLWETMSGFVPFLMQMPEDAWEIPDRDWV